MESEMWWYFLHFLHLCGGYGYGEHGANRALGSVFHIDNKELVCVIDLNTAV